MTMRQIGCCEDAACACRPAATTDWSPAVCVCEREHRGAQRNSEHCSQRPALSSRTRRRLASAHATRRSSAIGPLLPDAQPRTGEQRSGDGASEGRSEDRRTRPAGVATSSNAGLHSAFLREREAIPASWHETRTMSELINMIISIECHELGSIQASEERGQRDLHCDLGNVQSALLLSFNASE